MKFIDLDIQYKALKDDIDKAIHTVLDHGQYIMGPEVSSLEEELSSFVNVKHSLTCSSGTDALLMALMTMNVRPGDHILTTPFTYIATAEVISLLGAIPEFVDIDLETFNVDLNKIEDRLKNNSEDYKILMPVNIFGLLVNYKDLNQLKDRYNFNIIEDAAQSFGASYKDQMSCSLGDISCTSFFPAKPLGCYGDGGAVFTNNDKYADILESIRIHGEGKDKYNNVRIGINGRLDTIQAAILIPKLRILNNEIKLRNDVAHIYNTNISDSFTKHCIPSGNISAWAQYSILCSSAEHREMVMCKLKERNIPSAIYYITPLYRQKVFDYLGFNKKDFPISEEVSSRILSLPMHPYLKKEQIIKICETINEIS